MAKKKPSQPAALVTYTARAKDLKILGHVEAANDKEALQKARKQYGAATVERRETAAGNDALAAPDAAAAEAGDAKATTRKKGKPGHATAPPATPATTATPDRSQWHAERHAASTRGPKRGQIPKAERPGRCGPGAPGGGHAALLSGDDHRHGREGLLEQPPGTHPFGHSL
jgi:hypothetical protein